MTHSHKHPHQSLGKLLALLIVLLMCILFPVWTADHGGGGGTGGGTGGGIGTGDGTGIGEGSGTGSGEKEKGPGAGKQGTKRGKSGDGENVGEMASEKDKITQSQSDNDSQNKEDANETPAPKQQTALIVIPEVIPAFSTDEPEIAAVIPPKRKAPIIAPVPPSETGIDGVKGGGTTGNSGEGAEGASGGGGETPTIYDNVIPNEKIMFILDETGSMGAPTSLEKSRIEVLKTQLNTMLSTWEKLDKSKRDKTEITLLAYTHKVRESHHKLKMKEKRDITVARDFVKTIHAHSGNNEEVAFKRGLELVDQLNITTIYFISDGGRGYDPRDMIREWYKKNPKKKLHIHCIAIGEDTKLLKEMADEFSPKDGPILFTSVAD